MPEISRFYGIVIKMYFGDHGPPQTACRPHHPPAADALADRHRAHAV